MSTVTTADVHDEALALVREAVSEYLPYARARRGELDQQSWSQLLAEVRDVVAHAS